MNRSLVLLPADIQSGSTVITLTVSDGVASATTSFALWVIPHYDWPSGNPTPITIIGYAPSTPYPSTIAFDFPKEHSAAVSRVIVRVYGFTHPYPPDVGMLLVAPGGQKIVLMNRAGAGSAGHVGLKFSPAAKDLVPEFGSLAWGPWRPADYHTGNYSFFAPAPANLVSSPYTTDLDSLQGLPVNGTWSLYVQDDWPGWLGETGEIAYGWDLFFETEPMIRGLVNTNLFEALPSFQSFTIGNAALTKPPLAFGKFASDPTVIPIENIRVDPADSTGTNYTVTLIPQTYGTNVMVAISAMDVDGQRFYGSFNIGAIFKRPTLSISHFGGRLKIGITGVPNTKYIMQSTGDLNAWTDAGTVNTGLDGIGEHNVDLTSTSEMQFYRLLLW